MSETGLSDHQLLMVNSNLHSPASCCMTIQSRSWRHIDFDKFRADLQQSLNNALVNESLSVDPMINTFDSTVQSVLDRNVPVKSITRRQRVSEAWFDDECRQQKRYVRKLKRRFKRTHHDTDRAIWLAALRSMH